jgi:coenzyme F420 hydrogenase subunit beta
MPDWLRPLMGWLMPKIGPKGLEFARARLEMKALETVLHLRRSHPKRMRHMIPAMSGGWSAARSRRPRSAPRAPRRRWRGA